MWAVAAARAKAGIPAVAPTPESKSQTWPLTLPAMLRLTAPRVAGSGWTGRGSGRCRRGWVSHRSTPCCAGSRCLLAWPALHAPPSPAATPRTAVRHALWCCVRPLPITLSSWSAPTSADASRQGPDLAFGRCTPSKTPPPLRLSGHWRGTPEQEWATRHDTQQEAGRGNALIFMRSSAAYCCHHRPR